MFRNRNLLNLILSGFLLVPARSTAQDPPAFQPETFPTVIPPSPQAFSMTKYGDIPIGLFTGTAQFSVPLYSIASGKLSHTISLDYATNGVKVDEIASRVGVDWSLKAGGVITRKTLGLPDDITGVYRHKPASHDPNSWEMFYFLKNNVEPADPQPDEYSYSFEGYSGKFVIIDGVIRPLKFTAIKFEKIATNVFLATTPNGFKYYFGENLAYEESESKKYNEFERPTIYNKAVTAWYLTKVVSSTNDTLQFSYIQEGSTTFVSASDSYSPISPYDTRQIYYNGYWTGVINIPTLGTCGHEQLYKMSINTSTGTIQILDEIKFNQGKVKFFYSEREDVTNDKKIDSIKITGLGGEIVKIMKLNYTYSNCVSTAYDLLINNVSFQDSRPHLRKRLFLTSVEEFGIGNLIGGRHEFEYNDFNQLPPRLSFSQDLSGYFNGKINAKLFPNDTYVEDNFFNKYGGDRSFDSAFAIKGTLKQITYPTGGRSLIEYEPHYIYGLPKKNVVSDTVGLSVSNPSGYNYRVITRDTWTASRYVNIKPVVSWIGTPPPPEQIRGDEGAKISVYDLATNTCVVCDVLVPVGANTEISSYLPNSINSTLYGAVTITHPGIKASVQFIGKDLEVIANSNQPFGGLRVKSVQSFDGLGNNVNKKRYLYSNWETPEYSSGRILYPGEPSINHVTISPVIRINGVGNPYSCAYYNISSSGALDLYLNDYNTVSYTDVVELFEGKQDTGGIEHKFRVVEKSPAKPLSYKWMDYVWDNSPIAIPGLPSSNDNYLNADEYYSGTFVIKGGVRRFSEKKFSYSSKDDRLFTQDTVYASRKVLDRSSIGGYDLTWRYNGDYYLNQYFINQYWTHLDSTVLITYEGADSMRRKTSYRYDNLKSLGATRIEFTNSKKDTIANVFSYPDQLQAPFSTYNLMVDRNIIGEPVLTTKEKNGLALLSSRKEFEWFPLGNLILPKVVTNKNEVAGTVEKLIFESYDDKGNILEQFKEGEVHSCYVWDYKGEYPIANVQNASIDRIAFSSFESDGLGGWALNSNSTISKVNDAFTGKKVLIGGVSKSVPIGNYIVGVWSTTSPSINGQLITQSPLKVLGTWRFYEVRLANVTQIEVSGDRIDEVRLSPEGSQMTTYTFDPLVGMTSQCDVKGNVIYYEYDALGRLRVIRDENKNVLKTFDYQFQKSYNQ